jgi:hypothetical protein
MMHAISEGSVKERLSKPRTTVNKVLLTVLLGTTDAGSSLYALRQFRKTLLPMIWRIVDDFARSHVRREKSAAVFVKAPWPVSSKKPVNVNMLPIRLNSVKSLPRELVEYWDLIEFCVKRVEQPEKVGYLSVHESFVPAGSSQRRPGLHIESPGVLGSGAQLKTHKAMSWGGGCVVTTTLRGGIFFGSNVSGSCAIWPDRIVVDVDDPGAVGTGGSCEHLRHYLGVPRETKAGEIWWMTDRTPHEALPQRHGEWRQFFRLVVGKVSVWYSKHNTTNPLCPVPPGVLVIDDDKFAAARTK